MDSSSSNSSDNGGGSVFRQDKAWPYQFKVVELNPYKSDLSFNITRLNKFRTNSNKLEYKYVWALTLVTQQTFYIR